MSVISSVVAIRSVLFLLALQACFPWTYSPIPICHLLSVNPTAFGLGRTRKENSRRAPQSRMRILAGRCLQFMGGLATSCVERSTTNRFVLYNANILLRGFGSSRVATVPYMSPLLSDGPRVFCLYHFKSVPVIMVSGCYVQSSAQPTMATSRSAPRTGSQSNARPTPIRSR